jgi:hypothetical protein
LVPHSSPLLAFLTLSSPCIADDIHALTRANGHCDIQRILAAAEMGVDTGPAGPPPRSGLYLTTSEHPVLGFGKRNYDFFVRVVLGRPETASRYTEVRRGENGKEGRE